MLLVDDLAAGGTKNLRHTPRGLVTLCMRFPTIWHVRPAKSQTSLRIRAV